jgi:hypothetical protein
LERRLATTPQMDLFPLPYWAPTTDFTASIQWASVWV